MSISARFSPDILRPLGPIDTLSEQKRSQLRHSLLSQPGAEKVIPVLSLGKLAQLFEGQSTVYRSESGDIASVEIVERLGEPSYTISEDGVKQGADISVTRTWTFVKNSSLLRSIKVHREGETILPDTLTEFTYAEDEKGEGNASPVKGRSTRSITHSFLLPNGGKIVSERIIFRTSSERTEYQNERRSRGEASTQPDFIQSGDIGPEVEKIWGLIPGKGHAPSSGELEAIFANTPPFVRTAGDINNGVIFLAYLTRGVSMAIRSSNMQNFVFHVKDGRVVKWEYGSAYLQAIGIDTKDINPSYRTQETINYTYDDDGRLVSGDSTLIRLDGEEPSEVHLDLTAQ